MGILSQGMRIAPKEAPVTGYMFGKGLYFADMFSKSNSYAQRDIFPEQDSYLMMLCEVVCGNMLEKKEAENIEHLPNNKHSVKALG